MDGTSVAEAICLLDDGEGACAAAAIPPSAQNDQRRNRNKQRRKRQNKRNQNDRRSDSNSNQRNNRLDGDVSLWTQRFDQPNGEQECVVIDMCSSSSEEEEGEVPDINTNEATLGDTRALKAPPPVAAPVESELDRKERLERAELLKILRDKKRRKRKPL